MKWTKTKPTEPGWYWYEDEYYGPAPVYVGRTGFVDNQKFLELEVGMAVGDEIDQPIGSIIDLGGEWSGPIEGPDKT